MGYEVLLFYYLIVFLFGLCIGSFLNCVVYRMELQENMPKGSPQRKAVSFLRGKSFCPHCKHSLSWQDLIPVFSFLFLKGKCRYCKKSISIQYLLVELMTGLLFLLIFNFQFSIFNEFSVIPNPQSWLGTGPIGNPGTSQALWIPAFAGMTACLFFLFYIVGALIIIFVYDLKHYLIPDKVLFPAIAIVFLYRLFENLVINKFSVIPNPQSWLGTGPIGNPGTSQALWIPTFAGMTACLFFLFFFLISGGRWMGFGDVKLAFFMGLFLGYPNILVALFIAFFLGAIIGIGLIVFGSKNLKSEVPFGPFLITGTIIALLYGPEIIQWYTHIFLF